MRTWNCNLTTYIGNSMSNHTMNNKQLCTIYHRHKSLDSQKTYQQKPDIFQNKLKQHNKQLHRTNQTGKISQQAPKRHPKKTNKNIKKTRRNIRVLPSEMSPNPLGLTFWTRDTYDGCIFTRKKPRTNPKQRII